MKTTLNILKKILFVIGGIIVIVLLIGLFIGLFMDKEYSVTSEVIINKPKNIVFDYVKLIRNQEKYSKWVMADPNVKIVYTGTDGTVGFKSSWTSDNKNVGVGEQEITKVQDGARYDVVIRFEKPFKDICSAYTTTEAVNDGQTRVTTIFNAKMPFPMNLMIPMERNMLKKDMDLNGSNLKKILESQ